MEKQLFHLAPVEVVRVTRQNVEEVAEWCGGKVVETESRHVEGRMDKYVWVPTPKGNGISGAFPGMYVTKRLVVNNKGEIKPTWAVFRRDYFEKNYFSSPADAVENTWNKNAGKTGKKHELPHSGPIINVFLSSEDNFTEAAQSIKETLMEEGIPNVVAAGGSDATSYLKKLVSTPQEV